MILYTIGFAQKSAQEFFTILKRPGLFRLIDIRLNNKSQLAGFTKKNDLEYFLHKISGIEYLHMEELAPTKEILDAYKKQKGSWADYEHDFLRLMAERKIQETVPKSAIDGGCLLCSEPLADHCHRRLVAEYLASYWKQLKIEHL